MQTLRDYPVGTIDLVEVSPCSHCAGRTASMAATFLIEFLHPCLFEEVQDVLPEVTG